MTMRRCGALALALTGVLLCVSCGAGGVAPGEGRYRVIADTTFMADIGQNVAGERCLVSSLMPMGADPHGFEPTPRDAKRIADSRAIIINLSGFEPAVDDLVAGVGDPGLVVVEAAAGLPGATEDGHYWMDPIAVKTYVENIQTGLGLIDPAGVDTFARNAQAYSERLDELNAWITAQVAAIPPERRLLVTNHESLGRFAQRYGFRVVGAIFPTVAGDGSPSAQELARLVDKIKATGAPAVFLESGSNADVARQIASETGVRVVTGLLLHSVGDDTPTYLDMMRWNVNLVVEALR
jgi:ABC-type Zn uptake system ZnuABC Zn-binding protein ZnuA